MMNNAPALFGPNINNNTHVAIQGPNVLQHLQESGPNVLQGPNVLSLQVRMCLIMRGKITMVSTILILL